MMDNQQFTESDYIHPAVLSASFLPQPFLSVTTLFGLVWNCPAACIISPAYIYNIYRFYSQARMTKHVTDYIAALLKTNVPGYDWRDYQ